MSPPLSETRQKVVKFVQELLLDEDDRTQITAALIGEKIDLVLGMRPKWGENLDRAAITEELIRRFSLWIGQDSILQNDTGHVAWLNNPRKKDWRYWQRYREWLERSLSYKAVDALDNSTDKVLSLLEDPKRPGVWDRRGLVVGHVQSGKTGNYTGLICKAADAGYKIIIVLAGLHNNLRAQTQMRLDEGFLGYETKAFGLSHNSIGVGEIDPDPAIRPNYATNRSDTGDFNTRFVKNLGIRPEERPWLFVVKKNVTVLRRLHDWIRDHVAESWDQSRGSKAELRPKNWEHRAGRKIVSNLPLLMIDDEADHASVDTDDEVVDEHGKADENHNPTATNSWIRQILHSFTRAAYVGYTATPFANIFIHDRGETIGEGPDLFPSAFIINLAASSNYIGPAKIFDRRLRSDPNGGLPLVKYVSDFGVKKSSKGWMPPGHGSAHIPKHEGQDALPPSLADAIDAFVLACAIRYQRGQATQHCSMLIHVTRFTAVQSIVYNQVCEYLKHARQRLHRSISGDSYLSRLKVIWETDFLPTSARVGLLYPDFPIPATGDWESIRGFVFEALSDIQAKMINGSAKDALDYVENKDIGLKVIAVGGDKLARGLTLEGLCVSYFLRASRMYDTLMQMGRWFGYRPGYLDLCRLYTTAELSTWFGDITDAAEELREEFDQMAAHGASPREYGLKVQSHSVLMVTSKVKMRAAKDIMLSFSGQLLQTVAFFKESKMLVKNLAALKSLIERLDTPEIDPRRNRGGRKNDWRGYLWKEVSAEIVIEFLKSYSTHPAAHRVISPLLAQFIESMIIEDELTHWSIALIGGGDGPIYKLSDSIVIELLKRDRESTEEAHYSIGTLMSPRDESIELSDEEWSASLAETQRAWRADPGRNKAKSEPDVPSGTAIRNVRGFGAPGVAPRPRIGLLTLYLLNPATSGFRFETDPPPIAAFGISFPGSKSGGKVPYIANNVLWEQEYGFQN